MTLSALSLRSLRHFVAAAEEGSFTRAAARLGISPQAVSAAVVLLERQLGRSLLVRHRPGGLETTPAGRELLVGARDLLERADGLVAQAAVLKNGLATQLRVGLSPGAAGTLTGPILRAFATEHPDVRISVHELDIQQTPDLLEQRVDVAFVLPPLDEPRLHVEPLVSVPRVACVPFATDLADAEVLDVSDLLSQRYGPRYPWESTRWEGQWSLIPERNGEEPDRLEPRGERTAVEQFMRFVNEPSVIVLPTLLTAVTEAVGLRTVPVAGLGPAHVALARRPAAPAAAVAFVASARRTARALAGLLPGAEVPAAAVFDEVESA